MTTQGSSFWMTFMPHGHCYAWRPDILWLNVISDAFIALAYFSIPIGLYWVVRNRPNIPYQTLITMFSLFILCCGVTHVIAIWTVWNGDYGLQGISKGVTAVVSLATATVLVPWLPKIISLKTPQELHAMNQQLQDTIDAQKATQKQLERTEERLRTFLQQAPDGILIILKSGEVEYSNNMINSMFGRETGELNGQTFTKLLPKGSKGQINPSHNDLFSQGKTPSRLEFTGMRKDGSEFPVEISISPIHSEQDEEEVVLATLRDITDRKNAEEITRKEFSKLAHVSRLSTVGEMAAGLAHELNQPLTAISNNLHTAMLIQQKQAEPNDELTEIMQENYQSAQRAGQIIRSLRQLVRKGDGTKQRVYINDLLTTTVRLITPEARAANVAIYQELDHNLPKSTPIDTIQLQQVIVNLGRNAIEALAEQQLFEKNATNERFIRIITSTQNTNMIRVNIIDNGPGLNDEVKANLFQPYITSKKSGMGLGLSICRTIIESHGGRLWHENTDDQCTAFCFTLPVQMREEK